MRVATALLKTRQIAWAATAPPVCATVAAGLAGQLCPGARLAPGGMAKGGIPTLTLTLAGAPDCPAGLPSGDDWFHFRLHEDGSGYLAVATPRLLYPLFCRIQEEWAGAELAPYVTGFTGHVAFAWQRSLFDLVLTQTCRTARGWGREGYIAELARLGYSHVEVNGLAAPWPFEPGEADECLHRFYTYCPALDQFVASRLNRGAYPAEYLDANLERLKRDAALARKYGLTPSLLCFEPRSVPESLLARYPMLRGARVDHPFRSLRPRYNLTIAHPAVREHYGELITNLVQQVPDLGCLEIWSNDSGAAFEHTASLYAGRNGGAYLIREWRTHDQIARVAGDNLVRFLATLRDGARRINPDFRVILRAEPFWHEREFIEAGLTPGLDLSVSSLLTKGWDLPYHHPRYEDVTTVGSTIYHHDFSAAEREPLEALAGRDNQTHVMHAHGAFCNFEPLVYVPFPWLAHEKLTAMRGAGVKYLGHMGGALPRDLAPWPVNQEVWRRFQLDPELGVEEAISQIATGWVGPQLAPTLVAAWREIEEAVRAFPIPVHLYFIYGFVWYRLWVRPLVPDIEKISEADRDYYERHLLTTPHNPTRVDLAKDVLFDLVSPDFARQSVTRIDESLWEPLAGAMKRVAQVLATLPEADPARSVFADLAIRIEALHCWCETSRNVAAWIGGVHGYLAAEAGEKPEHRQMVREAVIRERANTERLLALWETSPVEFLFVSGEAESTFIHGENFGDLLRRRLAVMADREDDEPFIDPDFMWRQSTPDLSGQD